MPKRKASTLSNETESGLLPEPYEPADKITDLSVAISAEAAANERLNGFIEKNVLLKRTRKVKEQEQSLRQILLDYSNRVAFLSTSQTAARHTEGSSKSDTVTNPVDAQDTSDAPPVDFHNKDNKGKDVEVPSRSNGGEREDQAKPDSDASILHKNPIPETVTVSQDTVGTHSHAGIPGYAAELPHHAYDMMVPDAQPAAGNHPHESAINIAEKLWIDDSRLLHESELYSDHSADQQHLKHHTMAYCGSSSNTNYTHHDMVHHMPPNNYDSDMQFNFGIGAPTSFTNLLHQPLGLDEFDFHVQVPFASSSTPQSQPRITPAFHMGAMGIEPAAQPPVHTDQVNNSTGVAPPGTLHVFAEVDGIYDINMMDPDDIKPTVSADNLPNVEEPTVVRTLDDVAADITKQSRILNGLKRKEKDIFFRVARQPGNVVISKEQESVNMSLLRCNDLLTVLKAEREAMKLVTKLAKKAPPVRTTKKQDKAHAKLRLMLLNQDTQVATFDEDLILAIDQTIRGGPFLTDDDRRTAISTESVRTRSRKEVVGAVLTEEEEDAVLAEQYNESEPLPYLKKSNVEREEYEAAAREAVMAFLANPGPETSLKPDVRRTIRTIETFIPEASYLSRDLAIHVHYNDYGNIQCRFHEQTKIKRYWDGRAVLPYTVYGVGFPAQHANSRSAEARVEPHDGFMNCGCPIDDVLHDFYYWKTWRAQSRNPRYIGRDEGFGSSHLEPRDRTFVVQAFARATGLRLEDIYSPDYTSAAHQQELYSKQIMYLLMQVNSLRDPKAPKLHLTTVPQEDKDNSGHGLSEST